MTSKELLEPTGLETSAMLKICGAGAATAKIDPKIKPNIGQLPHASDALSRVKNFLPHLKKADEELKEQIVQGKNVNIEDIAEDSNHVEMNVQLFENNEWSEDSEPDSPPSPAERDNAFTSDSDASSTDTVSSSSSSSGKSMELKMPNQQTSKEKKKSLIKEMN